ncbi:MAG: helix-turn-helix domain-containing protein, partial [Rickettsiales bacterium]
NRDFIEMLSSIVTRELKLVCRLVASESELQEEIMGVLVTNQPLIGKYTFPVIEVSLPIRINRLLAEIEEKLMNYTELDLLDIDSDWQLSLQNKIFTNKLSGEFITLTDKESHLLQKIAQAGEGGISRESLMKEVWKIDSVLDTHTLETHIYRLRKKIKDAFDSEMIKAIEGGYRL